MIVEKLAKFKWKFFMLRKESLSFVRPKRKKKHNQLQARGLEPPWTCTQTQGDLCHMTLVPITQPTKYGIIYHTTTSSAGTCSHWPIPGRSSEDMPIPGFSQHAPPWTHPCKVAVCPFLDRSLLARTPIRHGPTPVSVPACEDCY